MTTATIPTTRTVAWRLKRAGLTVLLSAAGASFLFTVWVAITGFNVDQYSDAVVGGAVAFLISGGMLLLASATDRLLESRNRNRYNQDAGWARMEPVNDNALAKAE